MPPIRAITNCQLFLMHDIWQAETKAEAMAACDFFIETYGVKDEQAVAKWIKDRDVLLAFYDFPAEQWKHIRTTHPIAFIDGIKQMQNAA